MNTPPNNCIVMPSYGHADYFRNCLLVSIFSIRKYAGEIPIIVMYSDLSQSQKELLSALGCELLEVDPTPFSVAHRPTLTEATYFKFYIEELDQYDKVLWLDSDTIITEPLQALFDSTRYVGTRLRNRPLEKEFKEPQRIIADLSLPGDMPIIQGGVICISPSFMRKERFLKRALELVNRYGHDFFLNADQGILSILFAQSGEVTNFPPAWNFCRYYEMREAELGLKDTEIQTLLQATYHGEKIRVIHWNGAKKPHEIQPVPAADREDNEALFCRLWNQVADECFTTLEVEP